MNSLLKIIYVVLSISLYSCVTEEAEDEESSGAEMAGTDTAGTNTAGTPAVRDGDACETFAEECSCNTKEDCPQLNISIWVPTCSGDVLQTPTGTGDITCVEGTCQMDFGIEETDCAAEGKVCEMYAGRVEGDACVDPAVRGGDACPITAGECAEDSECAEGQVCVELPIADGGPTCPGICEYDQRGYEG